MSVGQVAWNSIVKVYLISWLYMAFSPCMACCGSQDPKPLLPLPFVSSLSPAHSKHYCIDKTSMCCKQDFTPNNQAIANQENSFRAKSVHLHDAKSYSPISAKLYSFAYDVKKHPQILLVWECIKTSHMIPDMQSESNTGRDGLRNGNTDDFRLWLSSPMQCPWIRKLQIRSCWVMQ